MSSLVVIPTLTTAQGTTFWKLKVCPEILTLLHNLVGMSPDNMGGHNSLTKANGDALLQEDIPSTTFSHLKLAQGHKYVMCVVTPFSVSVSSHRLRN